MPRPIRNLLFGHKESEHDDDDDDDIPTTVEHPESVGVDPGDGSAITSPATTPLSIVPSSPSQMNLHSARSWNMRMLPIKKHMVGGLMVPTARAAVGFLVQKRRLVRVEVRGPTRATSTAASPRAASDEQEEEDTLQDDDIVVVRIFRRPVMGKKNDSSNSSSASHSTDDADDEDDSLAETLGGFPIEPDLSDLKELRRYRLEEVKIQKVSGKVVELRLGSGHEKNVRDVKFESDKDCTAFVDLVKHMGFLERDRTRRQLARYRENTPESSPEAKASPDSKILAQSREGISPTDINLLVEIVSARNLPVADVSSADPYVIVRMGRHEVHRTKVVSNDLDPIWTLESGSLFLLSMTPEKFFGCTGGMMFTIKDYDGMRSNDVLGTVVVPLEELLKGEGERTEYLIESSPSMEKATKDMGVRGSKLFLRFKKASSSDIDFMRAFKNHEEKLGVYLNEAYLPVRPPHSKVLRGQRKKGEDGDTLFRVKPFPDPARADQTKWMSEKQIEAESSKESAHWIEAGSGDLGKVYVEIIGCDDLPNLDSATMNLRDKTDAFACCMFEDCIVNTDVVTDSLSPRWPPWCRRAFAFNITHPSSHVIIGLFDYDPELAPGQLISRAALDLHDPIGRTTINLSKLVPGTTYNLKYKLFYGEMKAHRQKERGTVHVRIRVEWKDVRKAIIAGMVPPPDNYVSVSNKVDFAVVHYTADGIVDERRFSLDLFTKYIEELTNPIEIIVESLSEAALVVWLWRGHYKLKIGRITLWLPLHSMVLYVWLILVTWDFNLFPSFVFFAIGWAMLGTNELVHKDPSRWRSTRRYFVMLRLFLFGITSPETIEPNENITEIEDFDRKVKAEEEKREARKKQEAKHQEELNALQAEVAEEDVDIASSATTSLLEKVTVNPMVVLKPILYPIQQILQLVVSYVRILKSVVLWEETYYAFWVVTFAFVASALLLFVPWAWLLRWTLRVIVWIGLGPWMMLVDRYYFRKKFESAENEAEAIKGALRARYAQVLESAGHARVRKERALKLKSMKRFCFGKYLVNVPSFREDLYWDSPLPASYADPATESEDKQIVEVKFGQHLSGDMVPQREIQAAEMKKAAAPPNERGRFASVKERLFTGKLLRRRRAGGTPNQSEKTPLLVPDDAEEDHKEYQAVEADEEAGGEQAAVPVAGKSRLKISSWF